MPTYVFLCECGWKVEKFFKSIPSEEKRTSALCEECGKQAPRSINDERFFATGGQHSGMEKAAAFSAGVDPATGRPAFVDENGRVREIRTSKDIDAFCNHNRVGMPRMVEWRNPKTGQTSWVAQRARMVMDPETGDVDESKSGAIIRGPEKLVPLDGGEATIPSESSTGIPIENGAMKRGKRNLGIIDPETKKPLTTDDFWGGTEGGVKTGAVEVKRPPPGKKWS